MFTIKHIHRKHAHPTEHLQFTRKSVNTNYILMRMGVAGDFEELESFSQDNM